MAMEIGNEAQVRLKEVLEIIDPLDENGIALALRGRSEIRAWLVRLKDKYTEWEAPDEFWE